MDAGGRKPLDGLAVTLMILVCAALGSQQAAMKIAAPAVSNSLQVAARCAVAGAILSAAMAWRGRRIVLKDADWRPGLIAGALFAAEFLLIAKGLALTSASHMVVFLYTAPVFAAVGLHWLLPEERLSPTRAFGVACAFAGVALAFFGNSGRASPQALLGDAMGIGAGLSFAATTVVIRCSSLSNAPATKTLLYQLGVAAPALLVSAVLSGETGVVWPLPPSALASMAYQALGVTLVAYLTWFWLLTRNSAVQLSVLSFLTPLFGVAFGVALLHDPLEPRFLAGSALVIVGVCMVSIRPRRRKAVEALS